MPFLPASGSLGRHSSTLLPCCFSEICNRLPLSLSCFPSQSPQSASLTFGEGAESPGGQSCKQAKETKVSAMESQQSPALAKSPPGGKAADGTTLVPPEEEEEEEGGKDGIQPSKPQPPQPSTGSLTGSPHLSELSITSQGGAAPAHVTLSPNLSPDTKQASPLMSPLLNEQACPRTDDEEDGRRKVKWDSAL